MAAWNFKKLERINTYFNIVAVIAIVLALSSIPICFFVMESKLDNEYLPVTYYDYELSVMSFTVLMPVKYVDGSDDYKPHDNHKRIKLEFEEIEVWAFDSGDGFTRSGENVIHFPLEIPKYDDELVPHPTQDYNRVMTQPFRFLIVFEVSLGNTVELRWLDDKKRRCEAKTKENPTLQKYSYCMVVKSWDDGFGLMLLADKKAPFRSVTLIQYEFIKPVFSYNPEERLLGTLIDCYTSYCRLGTNCRLDIDIDDALQSFGCVDDTIRNEFTIGIVNKTDAHFPINTLLNPDSSRLILAYQRPELIIRYRPKPIVVSGFKTEKRYSKLEEVTMSFAISSLIVTCFALSILLCKLLLFLYSVRSLNSSST